MTFFGFYAISFLSFNFIMVRNVTWDPPPSNVLECSQYWLWVGCWRNDFSRSREWPLLSIHVKLQQSLDGDASNVQYLWCARHWELISGQDRLSHCPHWAEDQVRETEVTGHHQCCKFWEEMLGSNEGMRQRTSPGPQLIPVKVTLELSRQGLQVGERRC